MPLPRSAARVSSIFCRQEVNEVMTSLRKSLGDVSKEAQAAVASLGSLEGVVEQVNVLSFSYTFT